MKKFNYLYVEDDPLSREVMETMLIDLIGVGNLAMFTDSIDFMARLRELEPQPDFILLDVHVEPYNGYEVLSFIRSDPEYRTSKVVAVTASVMLDEVKQLQAGGFDGALAKPLDMSTFPDLIQRLERGEAVWQVT